MVNDERRRDVQELPAASRWHVRAQRRVEELGEEQSAELVYEGVTLGVVGLDQVADRDVQRREREVIRGGEVVGLEGVDDVLRESLEDGVDVLGGRAFVGLVIFKKVDPSKVLRG